MWGGITLSSVEKVINIIKKDYWVIVLCLITILICAITLFSMQGIENNYKEQYNNYINDYCMCSIGFKEYNFTIDNENIKPTKER